MSFSLFVVGFCASLLIFLTESDTRKSGIQWVLLFYSFMELLQSMQYTVVNKCSNIWNVILTEVAYTLVIVQPLIWNIYFWYNSDANEKLLFVGAIAMSIVWMCVNILSRVLYSPEDTKNITTKKSSLFAASTTTSCTRQNVFHLYWEWPSYNLTDLSANYLTYLMLWFIPGLISATQRLKAAILAFSALVGLFMAIYVNDVIIFTSAWCYISVPIVIAVIISDFFKKL